MRSHGKAGNALVEIQNKNISGIEGSQITSKVPTYTEARNISKNNT